MMYVPLAQHMDGVVVSMHRATAFPRSTRKPLDDDLGFDASQSVGVDARQRADFTAAQVIICGRGAPMVSVSDTGLRAGLSLTPMQTPSFQNLEYKYRRLC
jgi:hypothetical protein